MIFDIALTGTPVDEKNAIPRIFYFDVKIENASLK